MMDTLNLTTNEVHIVNVLLKKNPELNEDVLKSAVAFIAEAHNGQYRKSGMPYTSVLYDAARKVLEQEAKDHMVRLDALLEVREEQFHTFGYPSNNWSRPDAEKCPVNPEWFDYAGGTYFMEDEDMSLEEGLRKCMLNAYKGWFDEQTIRM